MKKYILIIVGILCLSCMESKTPVPRAAFFIKLRLNMICLIWLSLTELCIVNLKYSSFKAPKSTFLQHLLKST